jgi:hypothetical protein
VFVVVVFPPLPREFLQVLPGEAANKTEGDVFERPSLSDCHMDTFNSAMLSVPDFHTTLFHRLERKFHFHFLGTLKFPVLKSYDYT